jgi:hypothetical protein
MINTLFVACLILSAANLAAASCFRDITVTIGYDSFQSYGCNYGATPSRMLLQVNAPNQDKFRMAVLSESTYQNWDRTSNSWSSLSCINSGCQTTQQGGVSLEYTGTGVIYYVVYNWNSLSSGTYDIQHWKFDTNGDSCSPELCQSESACRTARPICDSSNYQTVRMVGVRDVTVYCVRSSCVSSTPYSYSPFASTPQAGEDDVDPGTTPSISSATLSHWNILTLGFGSLLAIVFAKCAFH